MSTVNQPRILIIEDNKGTAELIRQYVEEAEYYCEIAYNAESGLALFFADPYDVVIIDYILPGQDGLNVINALEQKANPTPGIIVITSLDDVNVAVNAMKAGADDYIIKDVENRCFKLLSPVIAQLLAQKELEIQKKNTEIERDLLVQELEVFSYAIVHDLKSSLTVLQTAPDLIRAYLERGMVDKRNAQLQKITQTVVKIDTILDSLMVFAQTRNLEQITRSPLNMESIISNALSSLSSEIKDKNVEISYPETWETAIGYPQWVEHVWLNYISNAIKYGGTPPKIELGSKLQADEMVKFWVKDNGIGIPQSKQETLFLPFERLHQIKAHGHGLGLTIVRQIIHKLGGDVGVELPKGNGSCFYFTLPQRID